MMKKFVNDTGSIVRESLEANSRRRGVSLLAGYDALVRSDRHPDRVAVVSGGGAGHEPAHAGYVGAGMLTAAVVGPVFTSPSVDAVLAALRVVASPVGVLLIVKNYTGDRLNFGIAAELLRSEGIPVEMVVVADDVAMAGSDEHAGRRGLAGTVLVHKVAGALAESGASLDQVAAVARQVSAGVRTMGVSLDSCTVPGSTVRARVLEDDELEWGLGIHGEPGVEKGAVVPASEIVDRLLGRIHADRGSSGADRFVMLVNSLGATPSIELEVIMNDALNWLDVHDARVERAWTGAFLTALDTPGVSVTLLAVDDELLTLLDAETDAPAWPGADGHVAPRELVEVAETTFPVEGPLLEPDTVMHRAVVGVCESLIAHTDELTDLDARAGDGDLGTSLDRGAKAMLTEVGGLSAAPRAALRMLSGIVRKSVGGTSGPLYAAGLLHTANALPATPTADDWAKAFEAGVAAISGLGGASQGDATMLDALIPAASALVESSTNDRLDAAVDAASAGARSTVEMTAKLGRASYLGDRSTGLIDPGARAVEIWLAALRDALREPAA